MKKNKLKKGNIFVFLNILFLLGCCVFYGSRMLHFYKIENPSANKAKTLSKIITIKKNIIKKGDGLYKGDNFYFYKGKKVNNYLKYSGRIFRIISVDNSELIKLVTDESQTSLVWGVHQDFNNSYIKSWLNENTDSYKSFLQSLDNTQGLLVNSNTCVDTTDGKKLSCNKTIESSVGLISMYEYNLAGGNDSYLNNGTNWWTSNKNSDGKVWYIYKKGNSYVSENKKDNYEIYGVRPIITINGKISNFKGTGTKNDPYEIVFDKSKNLNDQYIGSYINYSNMKWIITEKDQTFVKIASSDGIKENDNDYKLINFGTKNLFSQDYGIGYYLNSKFYNSLDNKNYILKGEFNNGKYDITSKYDLSKINEYTEICNIGLLQLGELFINDMDNYYLQTRTNTSANNIYQVIDDGKIYLSDVKSKMKIRPTLYLKPDLQIKSGSGTIDDPFEIG